MKYEIDAGQEMFAIGVPNMVGAFFGAFPVTGSFSRTPVMASAGGRTPFGSAIGGLLVLLVLNAATGVLYSLPATFLAAMIMVAVASLVDMETPKVIERGACFYRTADAVARNFYCP